MNERKGRYKRFIHRRPSFFHETGVVLAGPRINSFLISILWLILGPKARLIVAAIRHRALIGEKMLMVSQAGPKVLWSHQS